MLRLLPQLLQLVHLAILVYWLVGVSPCRGVAVLGSGRAVSCRALLTNPPPLLLQHVLPHQLDSGARHCASKSDTSSENIPSGVTSGTIAVRSAGVLGWAPVSRVMGCRFCVYRETEPPLGVAGPHHHDTEPHYTVNIQSQLNHVITTHRQHITLYPCSAVYGFRLRPF